MFLKTQGLVFWLNERKVTVHFSAYILIWQYTLDICSALKLEATSTQFVKGWTRMRLATEF